MKYVNPEFDDWHPVLNQNGYISSFKIEKSKTPAIFGISFWTHNDCPILISFLKEKAAIYSIENPNIFWDDDITDIIQKININVYELSPNYACEMNTYAEYQFAQNLCKNIFFNEYDFFDNVYFRDLGNNCYKISHSINKSKNIYWLNKLLCQYGEEIKCLENVNYSEFFSLNEQVFILQNATGKEIAFFSYAEQKSYVLLRRIFIMPSNRHRHIGTQLINYLYLYTKINSMGLRTNVYDTDSEKFYLHLGFKERFKTLEI